MSGGGRPEGGGSPGGVIISCQDLAFETNIASPDEKVVSSLTVGAELDVVLADGKTPLVIARFDGSVAGSIVENLADLIRCLQFGNTYAAAVLEIDDGVIRVKVRPK